MGKRHNLLTYAIFENTKYYQRLDELCKKKKLTEKEKTKQCIFSQDTYNSLFLMFNDLFCDSNFSTYYQLKKALKHMKEYLYKNTRRKYSDQYYRQIIDKQATYLYRKIDTWYYNTKGLKEDDKYYKEEIETLKKEIAKEVEIIDKSKMFDMVYKNIRYGKKNYNLYLCVFNEINETSPTHLNKLKKDFEQLYGISISNEMFCNMIKLFDLVSRANNGINLILNKKELIFIDEDETNYRVFFDVYLKSMDFSIPNESFELLYWTFSFNSFDVKNNFKKISIKEFYNNFDLYYFIDSIKTYKNKHIDFKSELLNKIRDDLFKVYELINNEDYKSALNIIQKIIKNNSKLYISIS